MTDNTTNTTGLADFIFGTLATTADRITAVTEARRALSIPEVEVVEGAVYVRLTAGPDAPVAQMMLYFTTDGSDPQPDQSGTFARVFREYPPEWNTIIWGYVRRFELTLPASLLTTQHTAGGLIRYRVAGRTHTGAILTPDGTRRFSHLLMRYPDVSWLRDAVIYHIFVDRFATERGKAFATHDDLAGFYGGTLRGIIEKLDYLSELGVSVLWLSPIFPSPSHHGYDSTDFRTIEPRLGTQEDLRELINAAHTRGLRILLDFVPNHVSDTHPYFQDAISNPDSPYREYFTFTHWPDTYESFFGVKSLPQLNNDNPAAREYVISSAAYWLSGFGVDGFRLDYAYGPSQDFWADYYAAVKGINPQSFHVGEIVETPEMLRSFAGRMDGALDFHFVQAIRKAFAYDTLTIEQFDNWLTNHQAYFYARRNGSARPFALPTFLDNHDMNRFLWAARGDVRRLKLAALVQFTLPAPPIIYYGTETGLSQLRDTRQGELGILEESRLPMNWDAIAESANADLLAFYKRLIAIRRSIGDALNGSRVTLIADAVHYAYGYYAAAGDRFDGELALLVLINHAPESHTFSLDVAGGWHDLFSANRYKEGQALNIRLAPYGGTVLLRSLET